MKKYIVEISETGKQDLKILFHTKKDTLNDTINDTLNLLE